MDHTRHIDIYDVSNETVTLIGAGGIGAVTALSLAKMGVMSLTIYDMDRVGTENLTTQLHKLSDVGRFKVDAIKDVIEEFASDVCVDARPERVTEETLFDTKFVISAVDSIQTRKVIWGNLLKSKTRYYLDARMSAEEFHLYIINLADPRSITRYQHMIAIESDDIVPELHCTMKATIYCAFEAAAHISNAVKKLAMGEKCKYSLIYNMITLVCLTD